MAEDWALEAAHADSQAGQRPLVLAQTSNEHLDELNARAQAIRLEHAELGETGVAVAGRPYALHAGDEIQVRHNLTTGDGQRLSNGTTGQVTGVDRTAGAVLLRLAGGERVELDAQDLATADLRLAYVQHPFPAQGQTTDTTHVIVGEHASQEGSYVALTRARERTHLYTSRHQIQAIDEPNYLSSLAVHMSRSEPEVPSIHTPLAHEHTLADQHAIEHAFPPLSIVREDDVATPDHAAEPPGYLTGALGPPPERDDPRHRVWQHGAAAITDYRACYEINDHDRHALGPQPAAGRFQQRLDRRDADRQITLTLVRLDAPAHDDRGVDRLRQPDTERIPPGTSQARDPTEGHEP